jgi:hypothetical protein
LTTRDPRAANSFAPIGPYSGASRIFFPDAQETDRGSASGPVRKTAVTYHNSFVYQSAVYFPPSLGAISYMSDYNLTSTDAMIAIAIILYGALFATGFRWFERWFERE